MKKNKEGKVVASLTEVKNKTGDIFAVVDEFGEILLTSYNKPRYRITKVDLSESLDLDTPNPPKKATAKKPKVTQDAPKAIKPAVEIIKEEVAQTPKKEVVKQDKPKDIEEKVTKEQNEIKAWDVANALEKKFIKAILQPIQ